MPSHVFQPHYGIGDIRSQRAKSLKSGGPRWMRVPLFLQIGTITNPLLALVHNT